MNTMRLNHIKVTCADCGTETSAEAVNKDHLRMFRPGGGAISFGDGTTQDKVDDLELICECCMDDREEKGCDY